ncbi:MAG TPA: DUF2244 domain-containing protein [Rhizobacter sp.]|nr:DUF2244 domain-containing protein [Rhizobacter sp.]
MSATISSPAWPPGAPRFAFYLGRESMVGAERVIDWVLRRNRSLAPRQLLIFYASLCVLTGGIALMFWVQGARMVMPFAWIELLAVGAALLAYSRHAADRECIALRGDRLTVEKVNGSHVERVEFQPAWVRVEPKHGDRSLIELSGQGRRIAVGRFVRPEQRRQLAEELRFALRRWRTGGA